MRKVKLSLIGQLRTPAARLAHDLNNSLGALRIRVDLLRDDPAGARAEHVEAIHGIAVEASETARKLEALIVTLPPAESPPVASPSAGKRPAARVRAPRR